MQRTATPVTRAGAVLGGPFQQPRGGEEAALAEQGGELQERREERHDVQPCDAALQHLPRELEVDRRETVHDHTVVPTRTPARGA